MTDERPTDPGTADPRTALIDYAESAIVEDDALLAARDRAAELGTDPVSPAVGALLALLARSTHARAVAEIGTGTGVSGLWLLAGMAADGVLTTIDPEPEHHRAARLSFSGADIAPGRTRLINGTPHEVLPRLSDESYDIVFIDGPRLDMPAFVAEGIRMLRAGGVLVIHHAAASGAVADPSRADPVTTAARDAALLVADDDRLLPVVIPLGTGVLAAAKAR
ncbi:methyltransferase domain-containing protein [Gordonia desulfuricans]|uniref:Methyltransferase domain-containing protein n=1 Tax=Gordonia desulfuricans TaxID=89051 RepID=A0A7K3LS58_9ACTN|nr:class I SAM-dependent methyltransferase [Gordonia desulfuricans]NDK91113.1 methyltransferase domain-containing protein [Gordonia desulfuricans]